MTGFLVRNPSLDSFSDLRVGYNLLSANAEELLPKKSALDYGHRLAEHLMIACFHGWIEYDESRNNPLVDFFDRAPLYCRRHAWSFAGRVIQNEEQPVEPAPLERMTSVLSARVIAMTQVAGTIDVAELERLGSWVSARRSDPAWALRTARLILSEGGRLEPDHSVARRMAELCIDFPKQTVDVIGGLVEADTKGWSIFGWREAARDVLVAALSAGGAARAKAIAVVDTLAARGHHDFRQLLSPAPPE